MSDEEECRLEATGRTMEEDSFEEEVEEGGGLEEGTEMKERMRRGGRGGGRARVAPTNITVQTTSVISVERVDDERDERLGNSVVSFLFFALPSRLVSFTF